MAPKPAMQVFNLGVIYKDELIPSIVALMSTKSYLAYKAVFAELKVLIPGFMPQVCHSDFEQGIRRAVLEEFPDISLLGCSFHFASALYKRIGSLGLIPVYKSNRNFTRLARSLMSLTMLPTDRIVTTFDLLSATTLDVPEDTMRKVRRLYGYIRRQWLTESMLPILSVFETDRVTNNALESFHRQMKRRIHTKSPNCWTFLSHLNKILEDRALDKGRLDNGLQLSRSRKLRVKKVEELRIRWRHKLRNNEVTSLQFVQALSQCMPAFEGPYGSSSEDEIEDEGDIRNHEVVPEPTNSGPICNVCLQPSQETMLLNPCHHTFCSHCVTTLVTMATAAGRQAFCCPSCRSEVQSHFQIYI